MWDFKKIIYSRKGMQILLLDEHVSRVCQLLPLQTSSRIPGRMMQIERSQDLRVICGGHVQKKTANIDEPAP